MLGRLAHLASLSVIVAQPACASRLDFDSVSAEWDAAGDQAAASEAGVSSEGDARDASVDDARDASTDDARDTSMDDVARAPRSDLPKDAATPEAGEGALSDAAWTDGAASMADAGPPSPASDAGGGAPPFSCAQQLPYDRCDDFESSAGIDTWARLLVYPDLAPKRAGAIGIDNRAASTGQSSLLALVWPSVLPCATCGLGAYAEWVFPAIDRHRQLSIEFDMRVELFDTHAGRHATLFQFFFGKPERGYSRHMLQLRSTGLGTEAAFVESDTVEQPAGSTDIPFSMPYPHDWHPGPPLDGTWVHVRYVLDAVNSDGSGNSVQVHVGEVQLTKRGLFYGLRYYEPTLELGLSYVYTEDFAADEINEDWRVRYDNLVVRFEDAR